MVKKDEKTEEKENETLKKKCVSCGGTGKHKGSNHACTFCHGKRISRS